MSYTLNVISITDGLFPVTGAVLCKAAGIQVDINEDATSKQTTVVTPDGTTITGYAEAALALFDAACSAKGWTLNNDKAREYVLDIVPQAYQRRDVLPKVVEKYDALIGPDGTFIVDNTISVADFALFACTYTNQRWVIMLRQNVLTKTYLNFARQYALFTEDAPEADEFVTVMRDAVKMHLKSVADAQEKKKQVSKTGSFDIGLPGAKVGAVVTRFPPEPSGYLHIGHVKALMLNNYFAQHYKGKMLLRFDDTNPSKEKEEYTDNIMKDLKTLKVEWEGPTWTSDYFEVFEKYARQLIQDGHAYVDDTPVEQMREERRNKVEAKARTNTVEENMALFEEMLLGTEKGLACCLRAKIDMQSPVGCMRDPTLYRCNLTPHPRHGDKYKAYPTYDFACPIIDSIEGVTHALRTIEYHDRNQQYSWVCKTLGIREPAVWDFSRLNFVYTLLSKRKLQWFVDQGLVEGWFDPRFPTVQGIIRRGLCVDTLKEFMISQGASKNINLMEWDKIWSMNKAKLEPIAHRYNAIVTDNRVPFELTDITENTEVTTNLHPKNPAIGQKQSVRSKVIYLEQDDAAAIALGEEITVMFWGNMIVDNIERDDNGVVTKLIGRTNLDGDVKKTSKKLSWVGCHTEDELVKLDLVEYGPLITVPKVEESHNVEDIVNRNSKKVVPALGEKAMANLKENDTVQILRKGFYRVDRVPTPENPAYTMIYVPDGSNSKLLGIDKD